MANNSAQRKEQYKEITNRYFREMYDLGYDNGYRDGVEDTKKKYDAAI